MCVSGRVKESVFLLVNFVYVDEDIKFKFVLCRLHFILIKF